MSSRGAIGLRVARWLLLCVLSGFAAGLAAGIGARLAMRVAALMDDRETLFTFGGTFGIILGLTIFGMPLAAIFVAVRRHLPGSVLRKGVVFGAGMIVFPGILFFAVSGGELFEVGKPLVNLPAFASLFLLFGVTLSFVTAWLDRAIPNPMRRPDQGAAVAAAQASARRSGPNADLGM